MIGELLARRIGKELRRAIVAKGMTVAQAAERVHVWEPCLHRMIEGQSMPSTVALDRMVVVLGLDPRNIWPAAEAPSSVRSALLSATNERNKAAAGFVPLLTEVALLGAALEKGEAVRQHWIDVLACCLASFEAMEHEAEVANG